MRLAILLLTLFLFVPALSWAQVTVTITPTNTHQTWRFYGGNDPTPTLDDANCTQITNAQFTQALNYLIDAGYTYGRVELNYHITPLETRNGTSWANDNTDPFNLDLTGFNFLNTSWLKGGTCPNTYGKEFTSLQSERTAALNAGLPFTTSVRLFLGTSLSGTLPGIAGWLWNGNGSIGTGVDEDSELLQAIDDLAFNNYGFCLDHIDAYNEPDGTGAYATASGVGANAWLPGVDLSLHNRLASDTNCSATVIEGPASANGDDVINELNGGIGAGYASVTNSEASLGFITYHTYPPPTDNGAAIYARATAEGKQTAETEACNAGGCHWNGAAVYSQGLTILTQGLLPLVNTGNISGWSWLAVWGPCYLQAQCTLTGTVPQFFGWQLASSANGTTPGFVLNPAFYVFRQFSKYVLPGYIRVDGTSSNTNAPVSIWRRPSDSGLIAFLVNNTGSTQSFQLSGLNNVPYTVHKLDQTLCNNNTGVVNGVAARCTPNDSSVALPVNGNLTLSIPNTGVWTLVESAASGPPTFDSQGGLILNSIGQPALGCPTQNKISVYHDVSVSPHRWWYCTANAATPSGGHRMWSIALQGVTPDNTIDFEGNSPDAAIRTKTVSTQGFAQYGNYILRYMQKYGFNGISDQSFTGGTLPQVVPAPAILMPYQIFIWPSFNASRNQFGLVSQAAMSYGSGIKRSIAALASGAQPTGNACWQAVDPFDPNFSGWIAKEVLDPFYVSQYSGTNNAWAMGWIFDDSDTMSPFKAGNDFFAIRNGNNDGTGKNSDACMNYGMMTLITNPVKAADTGSLSKMLGANGISDRVYPSDTFNAKLAFVNWMQGLFNPATGNVTCTSGACSVTFTASPSLPFGAASLITISNCNALNTPHKGSITPSSVSATGFTYTNGSVTATQNGCSFGEGPNKTIAQVNVDWNTSGFYTGFTSAGVTHTQSLGTGNGSTTSFTITLNNIPVTPTTLQVLDNGVVVAGASCDGPCAVSPTQVENIRGCPSTCNTNGASSTINDSNGALTVVFTVAPINGHALTVSWITGGWGSGATVADEDGTHSWIPTDFFETVAALTSGYSGGTATLWNDAYGFLYVFTRQHFGTEKTQMLAVDPSRLMLCSTGLGGWDVPPRTVVIQGASDVCDVISGAGFMTQTADAQARLDFFTQNLIVDRPIIPWYGLKSRPDSYEGGNGSCTATGCNGTGVVTETPTAVSGNGTSVTATFSVNPFGIPGNPAAQLLNFSGCSISAFNGNFQVTSATQGASGTVTVSNAQSGTPSGCIVKATNPNGPTDFSTPSQTSQIARAAYYKTDINNYLTVTDDNLHEINYIGVMPWQLTDHRGEGDNEGFLFDYLGNPYDGIGACNSSTTDSFGYPTGNEYQLPPGDCYGNFLGGAGGAGATNLLWILQVPVGGGRHGVGHGHVPL